MSENLFWLKSKLYDVIQKWADDHCETNVWSNGLDVFYGNRTTELMTEAAFSVLLACADSQHTAIKEGGLEGSK